MADFKHLLSAPAGQAVRPKALPIGVYDARIAKQEPGDSNKNKTPYIRFSVVLFGWDEEIEQADRMNGDVQIDLTKKNLRRDIFISPDSIYRLDEFLTSCGIDVASGNLSYEEALRESVGKVVKVEVQQYINAQSGETQNQIGKMWGVEAA